MVKLRLKRFGRRNRPFFRLNAMDTKTPRNGESIEELGMYDPLEKDLAKGLRVKADRVQYWLSVGAQPSQTVRDLLAKAGVITKAPHKPRRGKAPKVKAPPPEKPKAYVVGSPAATATPAAAAPAPAVAPAAPPAA